MSSTPGPFSEWPWQKLGSFKYVILAPWVAHSLYSYVTKPEGERDMTNFLIFPFMLSRWLQNQIWISFSRFQTAQSKHRILDKGISFEQVDRERNWDDQILLHGIIFYLGNVFVPGSTRLPFWRSDGVILTILLHMGPVEFLYYWFHRALHHHYLYSRYHSHHHSSIVTEPITAVCHPFAETVVYFLLFAIPILPTVLIGTASIASIVGYFAYVDFMNNMGHCNIEMVPKFIFTVFPPLKYLMYTPSFHSLHHTQLRTNYCLFMPIYDYIYGTMDHNSDALYESSIKGKRKVPQVVHLTHPTTLRSIYHLRLGLAWVASKPYASTWYMWMMWPITWLTMFLMWLSTSSFTVERSRLNKLKMQTWAIPRYTFQYLLPWQRDGINSLIEKAILDAEEAGVKVISLGLLNQGQELNRYGEMYLQKYPKLKIRIVDGSTLAVATVLNSIPEGTNQVLIRGNTTKTCFGVAVALCQKGVQVLMLRRDEFQMLKLRFPADLQSQLVHSSKWDIKVWLVGDGLTEEEQKMAAKSTHFIPFSQFPPKKVRRDCLYHSTPAMVVPRELEDMHACENWLPRRMMSAWRVSGIVHALEGCDAHECGDTLLDVNHAWHAALRHGFHPWRMLQSPAWMNKVI